MGAAGARGANAIGMLVGFGLLTAVVAGAVITKTKSHRTKVIGWCGVAINLVWPVVSIWGPWR
jgi:hypothetical protein